MDVEASTQQSQPAPFKRKADIDAEDEGEGEGEGEKNTTTTSSKAANKSSTSIPVHFTSRNPQWTYLKLQLITQGSASTDLDALTARTHLTSALSQFLGVTGTAISVDILKIESVSPPSSSSSSSRKYDPEGRGGGGGGGGGGVYLWIRVPREDASAVVAAMSSWIGGAGASDNTSDGAAGVAWRVCSKANYLGGIVFGSGRDLF